MADEAAPHFHRDRAGQLVVSVPVPPGTSVEDMPAAVLEMLSERAQELLGDLRRRGMAVVYMHEAPSAQPGSYYGEPWSIVIRPADRLTDAELPLIRAVIAPLCRILDTEREAADG